MNGEKQNDSSTSVGRILRSASADGGPFSINTTVFSKQLAYSFDKKSGDSINASAQAAYFRPYFLHLCQLRMHFW